MQETGMEGMCIKGQRLHCNCYFNTSILIDAQLRTTAIKVMAHNITFNQMGINKTE